ncbi:MAG: hypothetical protein M1836_006001 [Candelina mexicana]|nr:MAG: hypothetical protein M1836_006001 [Candelina mexicana]
MAYYPPTPSFGLSFSLPQQGRMPTSSNHPSHDIVSDALPVTSNMEQSASVALRGTDRNFVNNETPPTSSSAINSSTLNAFKAFQHNVALPEVNSRAFGRGPPPPPIFGQFANGALPPPPYPPVPIPQNGFSSYPPPGLSGSEYQSFVPPPPLPPASARPLSRPLKLNPLHDSRLHQHLSVGLDREEGELSDAEMGQPLSAEAESHRRTESAIGNHTRLANGSSTRDPYIDASQGSRREVLAQHKSSAAQEVPRISTSQRSPRAQQGHRQRADKSSPVTTPRVDSYTSLGRRSSDRYVPDRQVSVTENNYSGSAIGAHRRKSSISSQNNPPVTGRSATKARTSAKHALLNLFPHNIRFEDIAAEGIDEEVLKDLYEEVGIKITSEISRRDSVAEMGQGNSAKTSSVLTASINGTVSVSGKRQSPLRSPPRLRQDTGTTKHMPPSLRDQLFHAPESAKYHPPLLSNITPKVHSIDTDISSTPIQERPLSSSVNKAVPAQVALAVPASPPLERKDKIARLLAAKNVKALPAPLAGKASDSTYADAITSNRSQKGAIIRNGGVVHGDGASPDGFIDIDSLSEQPLDVSSDGQKATHVKKRGKEESAPGRAMVSQNCSVLVEPQQKIPTKPSTVTSEKIETHMSSDVPASLGEVKQIALDPTRSEQPYTELDTSVTSSRDGIPQTVQVNSTPFSGIPGLFLTSPVTAPHVSPSHPITPVEKNTPNDEIVNRRKRPVASDFDPGPVSSTGSWKRPFGRSRTDQLIIEVSDDEPMSDTGNDETESQQQPLPAQIAQSSQKPVNLRDLAPLTDFSRKPICAAVSSTPTSALNTPPTPQKSTSTIDPDSLKRKEATIEEMRRKIAAMEQRARAKGSSSRAQTPATPGRVPVAPGIVSSPAVPIKPIEPCTEFESLNSEAPQPLQTRPTEAKDVVSAGEKENERAKEAGEAAAAAVAATAKVKAEEIAKVRAAALDKLRIAKLEKAKNLALEKEKAREQEKTKAAALERQKASEQEKASLAAAEEQRLHELELKRSAALEQQKTEEVERVKAETAEKRKAEELEKEKKAKELERARAAVVQKRKAAELEKAKIAAVEKQKATDAEKTRVADIEKRKVEELKKAQDVALAKQKAEDEDRAETEAAEQKRQRRAAIQSGLPLLDAQVAKRRERLEQLRREMQEAEEDFQRGLEERRAVVEEVERLGIVTEGRSTAALQAQKAEILKQRRTDTERVPVMNKAVPQEAESQIGSTKVPTPISIVDRSKHQSPRDNDLGSLDTARPADTLQKNDEIFINDATEHAKRKVVEAEDVMDISESSTEEGEITNNARHDLTTKEQTGADVHENTPDRLQGAAIGDGAKPSSQSSDISMKDDCAPDPARLASVDTLEQRQRGRESEASEAATLVSARASEQEEGEIDSRSVSMDDSDEYEPPEATPPLVQAEASTPSSPFSPASASAFARSENNPVVLSEPPVQNNDIMNCEPPLAKPKRFVPYESPLKQFRSFRYHPCFTNVVAGGFRSLTYSHNINESNPVCRYEAAGGICNDSTCDSQHFRDMGLSDDMILVQMGSVQEGRTPAEVKQYIAGLKQIIQEMRGRKVNDFNTVASEIAAYRARFLGDKITTLFSKVGKVDHAVFTAGDKLATILIADVTLESFQAAGTVRFFAPLLIAKHAPTYLTPGPESSIILTTGSVSLKPIPGWSVIASYAAALHGMIRNLALDLKPVRVNLVSPGAMGTSMWDGTGREEFEAYKEETSWLLLS